MKKAVPQAFAYAIVFFLLSSAEKALHLHGLSAGLVFALLFCRQNILLYLPLYFVSGLALSFSVPYIICLAVVSAVTLAVFFIHKKTKLKFKLLEILILTLVSQAPIFVFFTDTNVGIAMSIIGVMLSVVFCYFCVVFLYAVTVRGLKYRLSSLESGAGALILIALSVGMNNYQPFGIVLFYCVASAIIVACKCVNSDKLLFFAIMMGVGASIGKGSLDYLGYTLLMAVVTRACVPNKYICAVLQSFVFLIANFFFDGNVDIFVMLPVLAGSLIAALISTKIYRQASNFRKSGRESFALRTVVNRDRELLSKRLSHLATAFADMQKILLSEESVEENASQVIVEVQKNCCNLCPQRKRCRQKSTEFNSNINKLVASALANGKATLLDATMNLGEYCVALPKLINVTNDCVKKFNKAQYMRQGIEQGKEMMISQMGGVCNLLTNLSNSVNNGFTFDTALEKKLVEELGYSNIVASDIIVYGSDAITEAEILVRQIDAKNPLLDKIVSNVLGRKMARSEQALEVNGMIGVHYGLAPTFSAVYGERSVSLDSLNGDNKQAVRIDNNKLMFVLSDGMGTGERAHQTSNNIIMLIESFYSAGFDHITVLSSVSKLLSIRNKEDFSALDIAIVDTQNGNIDFIKQGGRESYVYSHGSCELIEGGTLPLGILEENEPSITHYSLNTGDTVIMISDGVADVIDRDKLTQIINALDNFNPQNIADEVVNNALRLRENSEMGGDDMSCIVIRLLYQ